MAPMHGETPRRLRVHKSMKALALVAVVGLALGSIRVCGQPQVDRHRAQRRICVVELGPRPEREHTRRVAGLAEAANLEVDPLRELAGQVLDVHAGATVDLRRELAREQQGLHHRRTLPSDSDGVRRSRSYTRAWCPR